MTDKDKMISTIDTLKMVRLTIEGLEELTMIELEKVKDESDEGMEGFIEGSEFVFNMIKEVFVDENLGACERAYIETLKQKESVNDENN